VGPIVAVGGFGTKSGRAGSGGRIVLNLNYSIELTAVATINVGGGIKADSITTNVSKPI